MINRRKGILAGCALALGLSAVLYTGSAMAGYRYNNTYIHYKNRHTIVKTVCHGNRWHHRCRRIVLHNVHYRGWR